METIDISKDFRRAHHHSSKWSTILLKELLVELKSQFEFEVYWEEYDECWCTLAMGEHTVAYICSTMPIVFLKKDCGLKIDKSQTITVIQVRDLNATTLSIDRKVLEASYGHKVTAMIDWSCCSASEVCYATVN